VRVIFILVRKKYKLKQKLEGGLSSLALSSAAAVLMVMCFLYRWCTEDDVGCCDSVADL